MTSPSFSIEKLVHGGFGLSHDKDGKALLIEGVIPGETVHADLTDKGKTLEKGVVTKILIPSPQRIHPPCPLYNKCGGCDFQHMTYPCQLQVKKEILKDLLERAGHPALRQAADTLLAPLLPSPKQLHYRQRIRLQVDQQQTIGFHGRRSHDCVGITDCLLAGPQINCCLQGLLPHPSFRRLRPHMTGLEILFNPDSSGLILLFHFQRKPRPADIENACTLANEVTGLMGIFFIGENFPLTGPYAAEQKENADALSFTLPPLPPHTDRPLVLSWETGGFCQVNLEQNLTLIKTALDFCEGKRGESILDLFCGMGNFSIPLAEKAESVLGIEGQGSAIRSAQKNSTLAGQSNTEFRKRPIHQACAELRKDGREFDCIVVDPPRQGIPGLARELSFLCRKRLVYISCDPATLCRDLGELLDQGFNLTKLQPLDMFPQTHHIETVALLKKE
ncbi:MAG: class I SAM-dependent RNA methyltransferase [Proteobacteria bacterium]|nr:class I SAM-dependent RNA methyltransferase [Pseudomonadota bacterium]